MAIIKTTHHGTIHGCAQCLNCGWNDAVEGGQLHRLENLKKRLKKHVIKTGHTVNLETGQSTEYSKKER